jgi:PAS domain S-box-containing protein
MEITEITPLNVICLEDSPNDAELIRLNLEKAGYQMNFRVVSSGREFESILKTEPFNLVLSDYRLPSYSGAQALKFVKARYPSIPFICISGTVGDEFAVELMKMGASDYVLKDKLYKLAPAVAHTLNEAKEKKALEEAENQLRKLSRALEQSPVAVIITDTSGNIEYINKGFVEITGYDFSSIRGKPLRILKSRPGSTIESEPIWKTISSGAIWRGEHYSKRKSGEYYWEYVTISSILDADNKISNYVVIIEDITEHKQMLLDLEAARRKAEETDKLKTAFLHNMSHEIRTPLNGILGFAELLKMEGTDHDQMQEHISYMQESGSRLLHLMDEIIEISMIESMQGHVSLTQVDLNQLISEIIEGYKQEADKKNISLKILTNHKGKNMPFITDSDKLKRILEILVENAVKFTDSGSIQIGVISQPGEMNFSVSDTGIGIPPEFCEIVFEPFRQADMTDSRRFQGAGIGLSIAKAFILLLEGRIWIESLPGKGTSVFFSLPERL